MLRRFVLTSFVLASGLALSACGSTVITDTQSTTSTVAVSTTLPSGPPEVLLPRLLDTVNQLSEAIIGDGDQRAILRDADALWEATKADVTAADPVGAESMQGMMDLAHVAVDRSRPADADKATKFLRSLIDKYLAD